MPICGVCGDKEDKGDMWNGLCDRCMHDAAWLDREHAFIDVIVNANKNRSKKPNIRTLSEEYAEAILAERGKHEHPLRLELVQIAGICINMIRQIDANEEFKK